MGEHISTLADDDCEAISEDFITVYREVPDGGTVSSDMGDSVTICVDEEPDPITVSHVTTAPNLSYWYVITDDNDMILAWSTDPVIDLNGAGVGTCRIWGWNYRGLPDPVVGEDISSLNDDDCENISANFIEVIRVSEGAPCITSTSHIESVSNLTIYPNPASDFVSIEYEGLESGTGQLYLIDVTGKTLMQVELQGQDGQQRLNTTNLPSGFYHIQIKSGTRISAKKFSADELIIQFRGDFLLVILLAGSLETFVSREPQVFSPRN